MYPVAERRLLSLDSAIIFNRVCSGFYFFLFRGVDQWSERLKITETTLLAAMVATVRGVDLFKRFCIFLFKKTAINSTAQMIPGQNLLHVPLTQVIIKINIKLFCRLLPAFKSKMFRPAIKPRPCPPASLDQMGKPAISP